MTPLSELGVVEAAQAIRSRTVAPLELVDALLGRIEQLEPMIHAWVTVDAEGARKAAREIESTLAEASAGQRPLLGVPVGLKDLYPAKGLPTTACFGPFESQVASADAPSVARLRAAGAIVLGKTVTTQFAYADPPTTKNPWRADRTPGGSSSGSAAAVASRMVPFAIGSQTAGSVLRPAAYNGVVGLKPTHGAIDASEVLPLAWSLDHVGPIARNVGDIRLVFDVLTDGGSETDSSFAAEAPRIGVVGDFLERSQPDVQRHGREVVRQLRDAGASVVDAKLPVRFELLQAIHRVTMQAEAASAHAYNLAEHGESYSPRIKIEAMVGQLIPTTYYLHAQRLRRRAYEEVSHLLDEVDVLLMPTASNVAPSPETTGDPTFQAPWSLFGMPSISLPSGVNDEGLPFGSQLVARRSEDYRLLQAATWIESVVGFDARPPID